MGLFDEIRCELSLPDGWSPGDRWFQTKSFPHPLMQRYIITSRGRLVDSQGNDLEPDGYIAFYAEDADGRWREYRARFREGNLTGITAVTDPNDGRVYGLASFRWFHAPTFMFGDEKGAPDAPLSPPPPVHESEREMQLLDAIKSGLPALEELLERASSHWGYEDPVYRLYHASFKVFGLQHSTNEIVAALRALLPAVELNEMFLSIIQDGTGKSFTTRTNSRWLAETRPIAEAFFHAKYFLEMAIRYGKELDGPPSTLPSGWAAVLYLYNLR